METAFVGLIHGRLRGVSQFIDIPANGRYVADA
jgi:hypothetical protein